METDPGTMRMLQLNGRFNRNPACAAQLANLA